MRLSRPNLSNSQPLFLDHSLNEKKGTRSVILQGLNNLYKSEGAKFGKLSNHYKTKTKNQDKGEERDAIEEETNTGFMGDTERLNYPISEKLLIPKAFGSLYLGEQVVLQFLIINESPQTLHAVKCKIEVQSNTQKQAIFDSFSSGFEAQGGGGGAAQEGVVLGSQQIFNFQAKHETKELGVHVIVCTIEFINAVKARQTIKKIFKFQVDNPLMVKTKVNHLKADQVYLEVQIQNVTKDVMWLEKMELEPHSEFEATNLNVSEDKEIWSTPFLDPNCARQQRELSKGALSFPFGEARHYLALVIWDYGEAADLTAC
ncbi:putative trafficking protein particle complex subunit 13-like protein [Zancudomyces culisetae]|uniref:Putative trafficking protein particle complex subunit 13-like protein n=1 Tax=Zancudomyces culisetae TaxID=1213189 RepID=A0A1R1PTN8_ZANCU|nr:putative trafficking protein particle complex subunit 13-like protein [Zancudomyces culisetae]|eukprot:OMH84289.1 putative trafficking protein particle complex subunit 13-like protein [Zancudomyces culisetae]